MNNIEEKNNWFKDFSDWFTKKTDGNKSTILLLAIICFLFYQNNKIDSKQRRYIETLEQQTENCADITNALYAKNIQLEKNQNALAAEIIVIKASTDFFPFPYWVKNLDGKMLYVNKAYEKKYLTPYGLKASDYINHYDWEVWGHDIAKSFSINDLKVYHENRPITFIEELKDGLKVMITKYPYKVGTQVFGIAGVEYQDFKIAYQEFRNKEKLVSFEHFNKHYKSVVSNE